tara:strand:- start:3 stop:353 length:351 start_codon:yes stop_codon:yes gene_type:complete
MDEGMMWVLMGLCVALMGFLAYKIDKSNTAVRHEIQIGIEKLASKGIPDFPDIEELREEVEDIIQSTMGAMRTPQIADHLGAVFQQWAQFKMQKEMHQMNVAQQLTEAVPDVDLTP